MKINNYLTSSTNMSKDNLITKFRDAMGLAATYASPIGGYLSSKVRQGLNSRRTLDKIKKDGDREFAILRQIMSNRDKAIIKAPGLYDPILYNSVINPIPYPARIYSYIHQGGLSFPERLQAQHEIRDEMRKNGYNPYIDQRDFEEEAANYKYHNEIYPLRALFGQYGKSKLKL